MKIELKLRLVLYNAEEEHEVPPGTRVREFVDGYAAGCPPRARKMLVDQEGIFRGVVLLNGSRADLEEPLKDGDKLVFLSAVSGG